MSRQEVTDNEILQGKMINTLLRACGMPAFRDQVFFKAGVMQDNFSRLWDDHSRLSNGEQIMFRIAREVWNWQAEVKLLDVLKLSPQNTAMVFNLYIAWRMSEQTIQAWLAKYGEVQE